MATNAVALSGNLVRDPELRYTPAGRPVLGFRIAVDEAAGKDEAGFFSCQAWGDLAENLAETLSKGQRVVVSGELRQRSFESNGQQRSVIEVLVNDAGPSLLWATAEITRRAPQREGEPEPAAS